MTIKKGQGGSTLAFLLSDPIVGGPRCPGRVYLAPRLVGRVPPQRIAQHSHTDNQWDTSSMKRLLLIGTALLATAGAGHAAETLTKQDLGTWGFDLTGRDTSVKPGDNFFEYANGTFVKNLVIPPDRTNFGSFIVLADLSEARVHGILEDASAHAAASPTDGIGKAGAMYKAFMDEGQIESLGAKPLAPDLALIKALHTP